MHLPVSAQTLPFLLTRTRDVDIVTRKLVYSSVLPHLAHPKQMTIAQREQIIKDGLGDREPRVRLAAGKAVARWYDIAGEEDGGGREDGLMQALVRFLGVFDVLAGDVVAVDALSSIFVTKPETLGDVTFTGKQTAHPVFRPSTHLNNVDAFWEDLTPESALLARVFVDHCISNKDEARLEAASLPVVTAIAFRIQAMYNRILDIMQEQEEAEVVVDEDDEDEERDKREEELIKGVFILDEVLKIAVRLDYSDEIGRRKVFAIIREIFRHGLFVSAVLTRIRSQAICLPIQTFQRASLNVVLMF